MEIDNALQDTRIDRLCSSPVRVYIPGSYTISDSEPDEAFFDEADFDPEAVMERDIQRSQEIVDHAIAEYASDPTKPHAGKGPTVHVGFDSEFLSGEDGKNNTILSLQFYLIGERGIIQRVVYPCSGAKDERPSFSKVIVQLIIDGIEAGQILEWPNLVVLCGFFLRIDLQAFGDLAKFKHNLDNVAGRVATVNKDLEVEQDSEDIAELPSYITALATDRDGFLRMLKVRFVDVGGHVAMGTSLAQIGDLLQLPKLELPEGYTKERMDLFLQGDKPAFEEYGLRDAEIAVRFYLRLLDFAEKQTERRSLPATASSLAVRMFTKQLEVDRVDFDAAFGVQAVSNTYWNANKARVATRTERIPTPMRAVFESFVASCYSGGRNECYAFGPTVFGVYNDFDLAGAYTTGMVDLRHIDYENFWISHDPSDFVGHVLGFAYVRFAFPNNTRYPSLPVRNKDNGLIYPLTGFTHCTAPEIEVALKLGCDIEIKHGIVIPWRDGDDRLFEPYVMRIRELRSFHDKGSLDELYAKLLGNSLYGKTAQGLKKKTVFEARTMKSVELPHSSITNAAIAAHTTGFIRAVLSEQIASIPPHRTVISATTDGFITDADETELVSDGPMARRFQALCERVAPGSKMLERKHKVRQLIPIKTRGQVTAMPFDGEPIILAKAGVSPDLEFKKRVSPDVVKEKHNNFMIDLFMRRQAGDKTMTRPFTPFREQWVKDVDVVRMTRETMLNLEFDFKRRLVKPRLVAVPVTDAMGDHVALDSVPWTNLDEFERARAIFDGWRRDHCIKTLEDFEDWDDHYRFSVVRDRLRKTGIPGFGIRSTDKGVVDVFRRLFLRAYAQELCGLTKTMTYGELANWLTCQGYPTTADELKNAKRAQFVEHAIPVTARVLKLSSVLSEGFPSIDINKFYESN